MDAYIKKLKYTIAALVLIFIIAGIITAWGEFFSANGQPYKLFQLFFVIPLLAFLSYLLLIEPIRMLMARGRDSRSEWREVPLSYFALFFIPHINLTIYVVWLFNHKPKIPSCSLDNIADININVFSTLADAYLPFIPFILVLASLVLAHILPKSTNNSKKLLRLIFNINLIILVIVLLYSIVFASLNIARVKSRDARRVSDVRQVQLGLELYADDNNNLYPLVNGQSSMERWQNLEMTFYNGRKEKNDYYIILPSDPCFTKVPELQYDYKSSIDGKSYIIRAILDYETNSALHVDVDGEVLGIWCGEEGNEREYCVTPH